MRKISLYIVLSLVFIAVLVTANSSLVRSAEKLSSYYFDFSYPMVGGSSPNDFLPWLSALSFALCFMPFVYPVFAVSENFRRGQLIARSIVFLFILGLYVVSLNIHDGIFELLLQPCLWFGMSGFYIGYILMVIRSGKIVL